MSASLVGAGWVTPLGSNIGEVWQRLLRGEAAEAENITEEGGERSYRAMKVPPSALQNLPAHPRLRRASAISRFAALAGLNAIEEAKSAGVDIDPDRTALIFAISNGGVIYTRRFYQEIVTAGAASASPILFPETVFNAPTSHLAALLGLSGQTYTLVGDGSVGLSALEMADRLLDQEEIDFCLVVGAEEVDWLLCDAYARWRLGREPGGMVLSEGAGAVLLSRNSSGKVVLEQAAAAAHSNNRRGLAKQLETALRSFPPAPRSIVISSANGSFIDAPQSAAVAAVLPEAASYSPKKALGESVGASGLWQLIVARQGLLEQKLPSCSGPENRMREIDASSAVIISCGLNQGFSIARLGLS